MAPTEIVISETVESRASSLFCPPPLFLLFFGLEAGAGGEGLLAPGNTAAEGGHNFPFAVLQHKGALYPLLHLLLPA